MLYRELQISSRKRNIEMDLSLDEFEDICFSDCHYCGSPPFHRRKRWKVSYTGVDRVDNTKGYTASNVVPCCKKCNTMKLDMTEQDFKSHVIKIGVKDDAEDKVNLSVIITQFKDALVELAKRSEYGHQKYLKDDLDYLNYKRIENAVQRYKEARLRHIFHLGPEDPLQHEIAAMWNSMAVVQLLLDEKIPKS